MLRERGCLLAGAANLMERLTPVQRRQALVEQQGAVPDDDGQQVVEVVRDPAGEPPDGFHLLRLAQVILGLATGLVLPPQLEVGLLESVIGRREFEGLPRQALLGPPAPLHVQHQSPDDQRLHGEETERTEDERAMLAIEVHRPVADIRPERELAVAMLQRSSSSASKASSVSASTSMGTSTGRSPLQQQRCLAGHPLPVGHASARGGRQHALSGLAERHAEDRRPTHRRERPDRLQAVARRLGGIADDRGGDHEVVGVGLVAEPSRNLGEREFGPRQLHERQARPRPAHARHFEPDRLPAPRVGRHDEDATGRRAEGQRGVEDVVEVELLDDAREAVA